MTKHQIIFWNHFLVINIFSLWPQRCLSTTNWWIIQQEFFQEFFFLSCTIWENNDLFSNVSNNLKLVAFLWRITIIFLLMTIHSRAILPNSKYIMGWGTGKLLAQTSQNLTKETGWRISSWLDQDVFWNPLYVEKQMPFL